MIKTNYILGNYKLIQDTTEEKEIHINITKKGDAKFLFNNFTKLGFKEVTAPSYFI